MKFKFIFALIISSLFMYACKTTKTTSYLNIANSNLTINEKDSIKFYFPEFYDENGNAYIGDGIVVLFPDNKVMVIDGFHQDASQQYIDFLHGLNINKIDYLIGTHHHPDHIGSFNNIIDSFKITTLFTNGAPVNYTLSKNFYSKIDESKVSHIILKQDDKIQISKDISLNVLWPNLSEEDLNTIQYNPGKTARIINNSSLVFKIVYKNFSILFTGDIYQDGDKELVKQFGSQLQSTIIKAPHHGEWYTANSPKFVKTVKADYAVIQDNRYITSVIKNRYKKAGTKVLYRLKPGYIKIETDGNNYEINQYDGYQ